MDGLAKSFLATVLVVSFTSLGADHAKSLPSAKRTPLESSIATSSPAPMGWGQSCPAEPFEYYYYGCIQFCSNQGLDGGYCDRYGSCNCGYIP